MSRNDSPLTVPQGLEPASARSLSEEPSAVLRAVKDYLEALETGSPPNRADFLQQHADIADSLARCLEGLDFIHSVGPDLSQQAEDDSPQYEQKLHEPLGDFQIVQEVGRGGMGVVYEAEQRSLGRRVALKVLPFAATMDPRHLQRFHNEARAAATLQHPHIVPVYAVGQERGVHYYAMQFIDGLTLAEVIRDLNRNNTGRRLNTADSKKPSISNDLTEDFILPTDKELAMPEEDTVNNAVARKSTQISASGRIHIEQVAKLGIQAAEALEHAHQLGIVHRDIKPGNLMVDAHGRLWVTDFGLAHIESDGNLTMSGDVLGTLRYMSPEQALAKHGLVDHRTDVYSLGATLYEMLTLEPAVQGKDRQEILQHIANEEVKPVRSLNDSVPVELETIVLKALAKEPKERYGSAQEVADDLRRFLEDKPILARRPSFRQRLTKWTRRHRALVWSSAVVLLFAFAGLAVGAYLLWSEQQQTQRQFERAETVLAKLRAGNELIVEQQKQADADLRQALEITFVASGGSVQGLAGKTITVLRKRVDVLKKALARHPRDEAYTRMLSNRICDLADELASVGKYQEAAAQYKDGLARIESWVKDFSNDILVSAAGPVLLANRCIDGGKSLHLAGNFPEAEKVLRKAIDIYSEKLAAADYIDHGRLTEVGQSRAYLQIGDVFLEQGKHKEAEEAYRRAIELCLGPIAAATSPTTKVDRSYILGLCYMGLGTIQKEKKLDMKAKQSFELAQSHLQWRPTGSYHHGGMLKAQVHFLLNCPDRQFRDAASALKIAQASLDFHLTQTLSAKKVAAWARWKGIANYQLGKWKESNEAFVLAHRFWSDGPWHGRDMFYRAVSTSKLGKTDEAKRHLEQAVEWMQRESPKNSELLRLRAEAEAIVGQ